MHETLELFYGFDLNLLCVEKLSGKAFIFEGEYITVGDLCFTDWFSSIRTHPFAKPPCRSLFGASHRSLHFHSFDYPVSVETPSNSLTNCLDNSSIQLDSTLSACILISLAKPMLYGSLFNQILLTCVWSPNAFLWWNWTNNLGNRKFPSIASDTCWTYANEFNTDLSDWMLPAPLLLLGSGPSFCTVLAMCAHLFRCPYTLCVQISNISMWTTQWR